MENKEIPERNILSIVNYGEGGLIEFELIGSDIIICECLLVAMKESKELNRIVRAAAKMYDDGL